MNIHETDCLEFLKSRPDDEFDMTMYSPPYEDCRTYGIDFRLVGQQWVDWMVEIFVECVRVTKGLVVCVVEGKTRKFRWSATPALLMADLHRAGVKLRKPPVYHRVGFPGGGGPDWWRNDFEFCVCASKGKLPWSDNTATGHSAKYQNGGACSNRTRSGARIRGEKSQVGAIRRGGPAKYAKPKSGIVNPGNVIQETYSAEEVVSIFDSRGDVVKCKVGKGHMGSDLAHENEAPYPESLVEPFVKSFCPPDGVVFDPFCGSGTTGAVAMRLGRQFVGCDVRASQVDLTLKRLQVNP